MECIVQLYNYKHNALRDCSRLRAVANLSLSYFLTASAATQRLVVQNIVIAIDPM